MTLAVITFSLEGLHIARRLAAALGGADLYAHQDLPVADVSAAGGTSANPAKPFARVVDLTAEIFGRYRGLIYIAPTGLVVRAIAPHLKHKTTDPAVVVVDVLGRWAISLLSGHEGGANELALRVANVLGAEPIITTTTEAAKDLIIGVGCRRGTAAEEIVAAVTAALAAIGQDLCRVRLLASADIKADEPGLLQAAQTLGVGLRFIPSAEIRACTLNFARSKFVQEKVNLPAVAEPCALLAGRRTKLLLPKQTSPRVTVAIAQESFTLSE